MASPQKENGHAPLANETLDHLAKIRISGESMQVLWVIFRNTYGYSRKECFLTLKEISEATGLHRQSTFKAVEHLIEMNLITQKGEKWSKEYSFQKNWELWVFSPKKVKSPIKVKSGTNKGEKTISLPIVLKQKTSTPTPYSEIENEIVETWNSYRQLPRCRNFDGKRKKLLAQRLKDAFFVEHWKEALRRMSNDPWALGQRPSPGHEHWKADISYFLKEGVVTRYMEKEEAYVAAKKATSVYREITKEDLDDGN